MRNKIMIYPLVIMGFALILTNACKKDDANSTPNSTPNPTIYPVKDIDSNGYDTIRIGTQVWLKQNLKTTKLKDGTAIPNVTDSAAWCNLISSGYCWYNNNQIYGNTYGALYNWHTVNTGNLCPIGWHVPSFAEWEILKAYLGGDSIAGGKLKEAGIAHWYNPNSGATNETGFTALPSGLRFNGSFVAIGYLGLFSSTSEFDVGNAWGQFMQSDSCDVFNTVGSKQDGISVRCIKD